MLWASCAQELACLHTDVLAALFRVEMAVGVAEQRSQAQGKQTRLVEAIRKREAQSNIFGVRTMKEKRIDDVSGVVLPPERINAAILLCTA